MIMDDNMDSELLMYFNVTLHHIPCKYATVDLENRQGNEQVLNPS